MKYVLISDGSSDRVLLQIINYTLNSFHNSFFEGEMADFSFLPERIAGIEKKILSAIDLYEPDIIFIHRDSEKELLVIREAEINEQLNKVSENIKLNKQFVKIIPVKMTESWLMFDEMAIKSAAGNPNGRVKLNLPKFSTIENIIDSKSNLEDLLRIASELSGRRLKNMNIRRAIQLIPEYIDDFSPLEKIPSYIHFKNQVQKLIL